MMNGAHYADADAQDDDEPTELADKHDGAAVERESIQATMEYEVRLSEETINDLPDRYDASEFAENVAVSRMNAELDPTFSIGSNDALASEADYHVPCDGERVFTVFVRVSQND